MHRAPRAEVEGWGLTWVSGPGQSGCPPRFCRDRRRDGRGRCSRGVKRPGWTWPRLSARTCSRVTLFRSLGLQFPPLCTAASRLHLMLGTRVECGREPASRACGLSPQHSPCHQTVRLRWVLQACTVWLLLPPWAGPLVQVFLLPANWCPRDV